MQHHRGVGFSLVKAQVAAPITAMLAPANAAVTQVTAPPVQPGAAPPIIPGGLLTFVPAPAPSTAPGVVQVLIGVCALQAEIAATKDEEAEDDAAWAERQEVHDHLQQWLPAAQKTEAVYQTKQTLASAQTDTSAAQDAKVAHCNDVLTGKNKLTDQDSGSCYATSKPRWMQLAQAHLDGKDVEALYPLHGDVPVYPDAFWGDALAWQDFHTLQMGGGKWQRVQAGTLSGPLSTWVDAWMHLRELQGGLDPVIPNQFHTIDTHLNINDAQGEAQEYPYALAAHTKHQADLAAHVAACENEITKAQQWVAAQPALSDADQASVNALSQAGCQLSQAQYTVDLLHVLATEMADIVKQLQYLQQAYDAALADGDLITAVKLAAQIVLLSGAYIDISTKYVQVQVLATNLVAALGPAVQAGLLSPDQAAALGNANAGITEADNAKTATDVAMLAVASDVAQSLIKLPPGILNGYFGHSAKKSAGALVDIAKELCAQNPQACNTPEEKKGFPWWTIVLGYFGAKALGA